MKVLVVNSGSSSLKYQLFETSGDGVLARGLAERIGDPNGGGRLKQQSEGKEEFVQEQPIPDHIKATDIAFHALCDPDFGALGSIEEIDAVGHRVVHGGERFTSSVLINDEVVAAIEEMSLLAPLHNPPNLMGIRACLSRMPDVPQVAVFDTAFHSTMPETAYMYALPYDMYRELGVRRYGFHGTSHKFVAARARRFLDERGLASSRVVTCHLGNGCSMAAVLDGRCVDTSMGMTPAEGLVMGTRSGDIDPAILPFLAKKYDWSPDDLEDLINKKGGLLGLSGESNDMRDVESRAEAGDHRAALALDVFCYRVRKYIGAYAAAMGGLDCVVFTGGIGENSPRVRSGCCCGLEFLGLGLDAAANGSRGGERDISAGDSSARVLVIPTNEELMIARETEEIAAQMLARR